MAQQAAVSYPVATTEVGAYSSGGGGGAWQVATPPITDLGENFGVTDADLGANGSATIRWKRSGSSVEGAVAIEIATDNDMANDIAGGVAIDVSDLLPPAYVGTAILGSAGVAGGFGYLLRRGDPGVNYPYNPVEESYSVSPIVSQLAPSTYAMVFFLGSTNIQYGAEGLLGEGRPVTFAGRAFSYYGRFAYEVA